MNRYSDYKFSGIDWLGNIPSHWILTKNRFGFKKKTNGYNEFINTNVLSLTTHGIKIKKDLTFGKTSSSYIGHQLVKKEDIVFTPRDFDQTPILSDVSEFDGCISNLYIVDETNKNLFNHYVNYFWYGLKYSVDFFKNFSNGMRYSFNRFQFDEIPLLIPPIQEQKLISRYLDKKNDQFDLLIKKIKKKIELIKEQQISLINKCITKGLDRNVEMKESGDRLIGKIPKHWDLKKLKHLVTKKGLIRGPFGSALKIDSFVPKGYKIYEQKNAIYSDFNLGSSFIDKKKFMELSRFKIQSKDILMSCSGTIGKTAIVPEKFMEGIINQALLIIRFNDLKIKNAHYIQTVFSSSLLQEQIIDNSQGGAMKNLVGIDIFKNVKLPIPPEREQDKILNFLSKKIKLLNKIISSELRKIDLLHEYRQSLLSYVVTGKVKVKKSTI